VVTEAVAGALSPELWSLRPLKPAELRGIEEPVRAFVAERREASG
jgi:class 3 adenylate cyclase